MPCNMTARGERTYRRAVSRIVGALEAIRPWQVFGVALLLRVALNLLHDDRWHRTENLAVGFNLASNGYFGEPFRFHTGPTAHVSPGYPLLIAAIQHFAGDENTTVHILRYVGALVSALNCALLMKLGQALRLPMATCALAALLWVVPQFRWIELSAEHETVYSLFMVLGVLHVIALSLKPPLSTVKQAVWLGLVAGVGVHFSPNILPMTLFVVTGLAVNACKQYRRLSTTIIAACVFVFAVLPYSIRNYEVMGGVFFIRDNLGLELAMSNAANARPTSDQNSEVGGTMLEHPWSSPTAAHHMLVDGELHYYQSLKAKARDWIIRSPGQFTRLTFARVGYLIVAPSPRPFQSVLAVVLVALFAFAVAANWTGEFAVPIRMLTLAVVGFESIYAVVQYEPRYVYIFHWIISLPAALLLTQLMLRTTNTKFKLEIAPTFRRQ